MSKAIARQSKPGTLPEDRESDFREYDYKCGLRIEVTGELLKRGDNLVKVGRHSVAVRGADFPLLIRLVLELTRRKEGTVSLDALAKERYIPADG